MKKGLLSIIVLLAAMTVASAQKSSRANVICGPYVQCVTSTGFTVVWITDVDAVAWVEVAPDDGTHFYNKERDRYYDNRGNGVLPIGRIHKIEIDGLEPGTNYRYRLMSKGVISYEGSGNVEYMKVRGTDVYKGKPYMISTFKEDYDTLRFNMYNDVHASDSLLNVLMKGTENKPDFVFLNGDMTSDIRKHEMISDMYLKTVAKNLNGELPLFVSRGNHELRGKDAVRWFDYFQTPTGTPYYSFSIGKYFFVVLDACEDKPDSDIEYSGIVASEQYLKRQEKWLKEALNSEECRNAQVRIAFCHIPPELKAWHGNLKLCQRLVPALNEAGIDAMLCGHIHRWRVEKAEESLSNANFPIICNPNLHRMEVEVTDKSIEVKSFNTKGGLVHTYSIAL